MHRIYPDIRCTPPKETWESPFENGGGGVIKKIPPNESFFGQSVLKTREFLKLWNKILNFPQVLTVFDMQNMKKISKLFRVLFIEAQY